MDLSPVVAWLCPLLGVVTAWVYGTRRKGRRVWLGALGAAIALGIALTFVQVFMHGACINFMKLCQYRGDGNMSYWFQSFFCIPIYWLVAGFSGQAKQ